jgi:hypothetical protein
MKFGLIRMSPDYHKCYSSFLSAFEASKMEFQNVIASIEKQQNDTSCYTLEYKKLNRKLKILKINFHIAS